MSAARHTPLQAWMQLLRPPNLFTVPGDPVAGFLLAGGMYGQCDAVAGMLSAVFVSLLFYMAGMVMNDCVDRQEDAVSRPERPLPSGIVSPRAAGTVAVLLFAAGLAVAGLTGGPMVAVALALTLCIVAYNAFGKKSSIFGPLLMGACRGLSLLMGAAASGRPFMGLNGVMIAVAGLTAYIAAVTSLASRETERCPMPFRRWLPVAAVTGCMAGLFILRPDVSPLYILPALASVIWTALLTWRLSSCPEPKVLMPAIGAFIRGLLLQQAAWMTFSGSSGVIAAILVVSVWPVSVYCSRRFYAS